MTSASISPAPNSVSRPATVLFPLAMPPVRPTISTTPPQLECLYIHYKARAKRKTSNRKSAALSQNHSQLVLLSPVLFASHAIYLQFYPEAPGRPLAASSP